MFLFCCFFFFKQKTAYEVRISDWSSDVCSSDLPRQAGGTQTSPPRGPAIRDKERVTMGRLNGKIALVTGAGSHRGLGAATAGRFAEEGAFVYLTDLDGQGAESVAASIRDAGGKAEAVAHDVNSEEEWDGVFAAIEKGHGRLDVIVNNAGIAVLKPITALTRKRVG